MTGETEKIELLIAMAERLLEAVELDIDALKAGKPQLMRTLNPEIQRLSIMYAREASSLDPDRTKTAPPELRRRFATVTGEFKQALGLHARLIGRMRHASEGIVRAVAEEVERRRAPLTSYAPKTNTAFRRPGGAIVFNSVV
jgi:hypothetical protein